ncbi:hypothetical protein T552_00282 [Pneumocystis carinii B80]|uniref:Uncharacterized protein n=1 Tax=Pneumocystis carinii (strain B80) TaxID=1408658 RepID=A0A0W4ZTE0_PNEC8|nr:hypothetical protein T552_00282 [Pneumocystis carinii B80]KTW31644.1 hypothetical protein T552_00282 [Pneumocystis carinii B80]
MLHSITNRKYLQISNDLLIEMRFFLNNAYPSSITDSVLQNIIDFIKPSIILKLQKDQLQKQKKNAKDLIENDKFKITLFFVPSKSSNFLLKRVTTFVFPLEDKDKSTIDHFTENTTITNFDTKDDPSSDSALDSSSFVKSMPITTYKKCNTYKKILYVEVSFKD